MRSSVLEAGRRKTLQFCGTGKASLFFFGDDGGPLSLQPPPGGLQPALHLQDQPRPGLLRRQPRRRRQRRGRRRRRREGRRPAPAAVAGQLRRGRRRRARRRPVGAQQVLLGALLDDVHLLALRRLPPQPGKFKFKFVNPNVDSQTWFFFLPPGHLLLCLRPDHLLGVGDVGVGYPFVPPVVSKIHFFAFLGRFYSVIAVLT